MSASLREDRRKAEHSCLIPHASCLLLALLLAAPAMAQDYSKPTLMRILSNTVEPPPRGHRIQHRFGLVEFRALGMDWRVSYLPIMMPLAGSRMTTSKEWPDAFSLTNTPIASSPRTWRDRRSIAREIRRIDRLERKRGKVVVQP